MRAILQLFAVAAAVAILGLGERPELLAGGAVALVAIAIAMRPSKPEGRAPRSTAQVMPLQPPLDLEEDLEGKTVPARMSERTAYEMHAQYAPSFDQQLALTRHLERYGDEQYVPDSPGDSGFDPERYAQGRAYAEAFDRQLATQRRTQAYEAVRPRFARGSSNDYSQAVPRSSHLEPQPEGWDPHKPPSITAMRRVK